jgi:hypothetical protein
VDARIFAVGIGVSPWNGELFTCESAEVVAGGVTNECHEPKVIHGGVK